MRLLLTTIFSLMFASLALAEVTRLSEPVEATDQYEVFGAALEDKSSGQSLQSVVDQEDTLDGQTVRVTTRVAKVCQKKGCFFIATEGATWARVSFADYGFFIPTDSGGKDVTLVGTFSRKALSPEQAAHYAEDLGEEPGKAAAPQIEYAIVATSVLIPRG